MKSIYVITILILSLMIQVSVNPYGVFADSQSILYPTDDAYVAIDKADPENNEGLQTMLLGKIPYLKTWSALGVNEEGNVIESINFLKFDLSNFSSEDISDATINLKPFVVMISEIPKRIAIFEVTENDWTENSLTYKYKPSDTNSVFSFADITEPDVWYSWDVTELAKKYAGSTLSVVLRFQNIIIPGEEIVTFYSKETVEIDNRPFMAISTNTASIYSQESEIITLNPIDDAYVTADMNNSDDAQHYRDQITGNLEFLRTWYAWNVTENQEQIISSPFLKFDLSEIKSEQIINANLKLRIFVGNTSEGNAPELALALVSSNNWNESELTYNNQPEHSPDNSVISTMIDNHWYSWDVTDFVKQNAGTSLSIMFSHKNINENAEEVISFHSKETSEPGKAPVLEIEYSLADTTTEGGGCLIATATYRTELSTQVQQLRELRDNTLLQTNSGSAFMESFNAIYYSISPGIADLERQNPAFKEMVKIAITPLILSLSILNYVYVDSEAEMISYGISIIALNLAMYFGLPIFAILKISKLKTTK